MERRKFVKSILAMPLLLNAWPSLSYKNHREETIMKKILHRAESRGHANHGWLNSYHTFSFANYYNPERMNFGLLRVLNDDTVAPGMGFGKHPHDNMEIISIPLQGSLEHQDSMGNQIIIRPGEVQIMSAGTGIKHSEFNRSREEEVRFLQIWVFPKEQDITPRYGQKAFSGEEKKNKFLTVVSPREEDEALWINQDAFFSLGDLDKDIRLTYTLNKPGNGVYIFVLEGSVEAGGETLNRRDGLGIWETESVDIKAASPSSVLLMEVPMQ